jgi:nucleoside-diphosphate-sugar epimerase
MIFVIGCDGYIGNALTQRLLNEGEDCFVVAKDEDTYKVFESDR